LRQEVALRRAQQAQVAQEKARGDAARAALAATRKELKGRDYCYDRAGTLVPLARPKPEALPAVPAPAASVAPLQAPAGAVAPAAAGKTAPGAARAAAAGGTGPAHKRGGGAGGAAAAKARGEFIEAPSRAQPSALETLKPGTGVTLRAGAAAKQGPRPPPTLARAAYQAAAKAALQQERAKAAAAAAAVAAAVAQQQQQQPAAVGGAVPGAGRSSAAAARPSAGPAGQGLDLADPSSGFGSRSGGQAGGSGPVEAGGGGKPSKAPAGTVAAFLASPPSTAPPIHDSLAGARRPGEAGADAERRELDVNLALIKVGAANSCAGNARPARSAPPASLTLRAHKPYLPSLRLTTGAARPRAVSRRQSRRAPKSPTPGSCERRVSGGDAG
jgi:hypothetical protein